MYHQLPPGAGGPIGPQGKFSKEFQQVRTCYLHFKTTRTYHDGPWRSRNASNVFSIVTSSQCSEPSSTKSTNSGTGSASKQPESSVLVSPD